jgi:hypothetical protein
LRPAAWPRAAAELRSSERQRFPSRRRLHSHKTSKIDQEWKQHLADSGDDYKKPVTGYPGENPPMVNDLEARWEGFKTFYIRKLKNLDDDDQLRQNHYYN